MPNKIISAHRLATQLPFAIYGVAGRVARMHKPFLDPLGLTFPQYLVMLELYAGTPRYVGDLGTSLGMDTGTITPLLKRLEVCGMISRLRDPSDERRVIINLTPTGEAIKEEVWNVAGQIKSACKMDEAGMASLRDTLNDFARPAVD
ncbi:MAG: MarR family transcriptional regulator [Cypionkella sp.]|uniref:MarR family winged helix-turn-helix transcriptional regulator n=1 Tax=Cypionkella sp. TaxID=2811411 RepID=UPI00261294A2|nr:MarR family winged helix-turn-helix transcriptional regulator [Cypionkella sp.]MDB5660519.1 MarR family transcriptional regulator [Cypionkella sp.]